MSRSDDMTVSLRALAHARSGDKGNISNIAVIAYHDDLYPVIREQVTAERVAEHFAGVVRGEVLRYEVDRLGVLNFVMHDALGGGVSRNLCLDNYGKSFSAGLLGMKVRVPARLANRLRGPVDRDAG